MFSSGGRVRNADHRSEESAIQGASLPGARLVWGGICQTEVVANVFCGAWNTDKENQVWWMTADLDRDAGGALLREQATLDL